MMQGMRLRQARSQILQRKRRRVLVLMELPARMKLPIKDRFEIHGMRSAARITSADRRTTATWTKTAICITAVPELPDSQAILREAPVRSTTDSRLELPRADTAPKPTDLMATLGQVKLTKTLEQAHRTTETLQDSREETSLPDSKTTNSSQALIPVPGAAATA